MSLRKTFARDLDLFKVGELSIDDFEEKYFLILSDMKSREDGDIVLVKEIFMQVWQMYDDFRDDYLDAGDRELNSIDRYISFLMSNCVYRWPKLGGSGFLRFFTFGLYNKYRRKQLERIGDFEVWPFFTKQEYEEAENSRLE